jgi:RNA polymerase sigma-70 factor (ECF subfamily)
LTVPFEISLAASTPLSFDDLVRRHQAMVFRTAWRMLGSPADAEDVAQDVFLKLHGYRGEASTAWIYRVTVNLCLDQIRKRRPQSEETTLATLVAEGQSPEERFEHSEMQLRLARLIARLPERERACLVLRDLEGLNSREVAVILDCSEETVRSAIHRAKEKLKLWIS